jgi:hypothetical protein
MTCHDMMGLILSSRRREFRVTYGVCRVPVL